MYLRHRSLLLCLPRPQYRRRLRRMQTQLRAHPLRKRQRRAQPRHRRALLRRLLFSRRLRRHPELASVPIIMLTARGEEEDRIRGLETGADDYVTKPFSPRELIVRLAAILRRTRPALAGKTLKIEDLELDPAAHRVRRSGQEVPLGPTEFRLLQHFMERPGRVLSRAQLVTGVWGQDSDIEERTVDVQVKRLRAAINAPGGKDMIRTVRSAGYSLG